MINFIEKIISEKNSTEALEKSQKRIDELEDAISQLVGVLAEHQKMIEKISENQSILINALVSDIAPFREEDLN
jgi:hypothetical protein